MDLDELKAKLENKNEVVYPTGDYDKRERMAEPINEEKAALPLHSVIGRLLRNLHIKCDKCADGRVKHDHSEQIGSTWIEVYKCDRCGEQFV